MSLSKRYSTWRCKMSLTDIPRTVTARTDAFRRSIAQDRPAMVTSHLACIKRCYEKFHYAASRLNARFEQRWRLLGNEALSRLLGHENRRCDLKRIESIDEQPVYEAIRTHHQQSAYFHADETRWRVFRGKSRKNWTSLVVVAVRREGRGGLCTRSQPYGSCFARRRIRRMSGSKERCLCVLGGIASGYSIRETPGTCSRTPCKSL